MTPSVDSSLDIDVVEQEQQPSLTWQLDLNSGRIKGMIDGADAIRQAVEKILLTERYAYRIYSWNYGVELVFYIGKDTDFVMADAERSIRDALMQDERILNIYDFEARLINKETVQVSFTLDTTAGKLDYTKEIRVL